MTATASPIAPAAADTGFGDGYYWSADGLRLHFRDYAPDVGSGGAPGIPIVCIPGLTRNARDFEDVAPRLAAAGHRVLAVELRGRGDSAYASDPMSYLPLTYAQDVAALIAEQGFDRYIHIGTSLGGIVGMILAALLPGKIAGIVLNDVGPVVDPAGLERIRGYVGQGGTQRTWVHAARIYAEQAGPERFPHYELADWIRLVKRAWRLTREGRIALDYDMRIAEPFNVPGAETGADLWPALDALRDIPTLIVRGANSDILSPDTAAQMLARLTQATLVTVPDVGHAPSLEEPEAVAGIDALIARAAKQAPA